MTTNQSPIRILFLAAIPHDISPVSVAEECRRIEQALERTEFGNRFVLQAHWAVQVGDLQELLLRHQPHIVHFSGHGSPANELIFQDRDGNAHPLSPGALSRLFCLLSDNITCVVLNACYTERQAQEIAKHINCVIGMSDAIQDDAALLFSTAFYRALGFGRDMKTAFELGCSEIESSVSELAEHLKPRLLSPAYDPAQLFLLQIPESPRRTRALAQCSAQQRSRNGSLSPIDTLLYKGKREDWIAVNTMQNHHDDVDIANANETCMLCDLS